MKVAKAFFYTGIATFIRIISGFIISKIMAVYAGPAGLVIVGQFQNFLTLTQAFGASSIQAGVIKYISEANNNSKKKDIILSTSLTLVLCFSITMSFLIFFLSKNLSFYFMGNDYYRLPIIIYSISIIFFNINTLFLSIFQGEKNVKIYSIANVASSISGLLLILLLINTYNALGAVYALATYQSLSFIVSLYYIKKLKIFKFNIFKFNFFNSSFRGVYIIPLLKYGTMTIVSGIVSPLSQMYVRQAIIYDSSIEAAGYWEAMLKMSAGFLMLITTTFSVYYLPNLSQARSKEALLRNVYQILTFTIPCTIIIGFVIFYFKEQLILIFFDKKFLPVVDLIGYQLIGDVFKCVAWAFAYIMLAKALIKTFIISEILFSISFVLFSIFFIEKFQLLGVTYAYILNNFIYLLASIFIFYKFIRTLEKKCL